jgi:methionyl aminopeptidase
VYRMIIRKTPEQVDQMAAAGAILVRCMKVLESKVRAGITTGELDAAAEKFIRSQGALPAFKGYRGFPGSICASPNAMVVHGIPGPYELKRGDIISIDIGVVKDGWVADAAFTFPVGPIDAEARRLLDVTKASLFAGVEQMRPGNHLGDVSSAIQRAVEAENLSIIRTLVGHGVGRDMHEEPQVPNFGEPGRGPELEEGMSAGADGRRRLVGLFRGRNARRPLRVHRRGDPRRPTHPHSLARVRVGAPRPLPAGEFDRIESAAAVGRR